MCLFLDSKGLLLRFTILSCLPGILQDGGRGRFHGRAGLGREASGSQDKGGRARLLAAPPGTSASPSGAGHVRLDVLKPDSSALNRFPSTHPEVLGVTRCGRPSALRPEKLVQPTSEARPRLGQRGVGGAGRAWGGFRASASDRRGAIPEPVDLIACPSPRVHRAIRAAAAQRLGCTKCPLVSGGRRGAGSEPRLPRARCPPPLRPPPWNLSEEVARGPPAPPPPRDRLSRGRFLRARGALVSN